MVSDHRAPARKTGKGHYGRSGSSAELSNSTRFRGGRLTNIVEEVFSSAGVSLSPVVGKGAGKNFQMSVPTRGRSRSSRSRSRRMRKLLVMIASLGWRFGSHLRHPDSGGDETNIRESAPSATPF